jgi:hypothetical protein
LAPVVLRHVGHWSPPVCYSPRHACLRRARRPSLFNHEFMTQRHPGGGALGAPATGTAGRIAGETSALRASSRAVNTERSAPDIADVVSSCEISGLILLERLDADGVGARGITPSCWRDSEASAPPARRCALTACKCCSLSLLGAEEGHSSRPVDSACAASEDPQPIGG